MIKVCKASLSMLFINLYVVFTLTGSYIPYGTVLFGMICVATVILDAYTNKFADFIYVQIEIITMFLFIGVAVISAPIVSYSTSSAFSAIEDFIQKWIFCLVVYYVCVRERSVEFPLKLFITIGLVSSLIVISSNAIQSRVSLSENIGENGLGNLMVLAFFGVLYFMDKYKKIQYDIVGIGCMLIFLYTILLSGSRKSLYAIGILVGLCAIYYLVRMGRYVTYRAFLIVVVVLALAFISYKYLLPVFENTSMYLRLYGSQAAHAAESNEGRILLYRQAYKDFLSSPFFGIGFKNFAVKHGAYTHSAYAEVLACTGIFGVLLYFTSYIKTWSSLNNAIVLSKYKFDGSVDQQYLIKFMFYVFLFIGLGIGHLYDNISMLELGIFMASGAIAKIQYGEAENHS